MNAPGPLVTLVLLTYNHERFVRRALEGVFSQTYQPLEVILSDDCSSDCTFEILAGEGSAYRGPHRVTWIRSETNLGLAAHVNRVVESAAGELIVGAAGDDVSKPDRVKELVTAWERTGRSANSVVSGFESIDGEGGVLGRHPHSLDPRALDLGWRVRFGPSVLGATHAFTKRTFEVFGPLAADVLYEDRVIGFRSFLLGPVVEVPGCLVQYRTHGGNLWNARARTSPMARFSWSLWVREARRASRAGHAEARQFLEALRTVGPGGNTAEHEEAVRTLQAKERFWRSIKKSVESSSRIRFTWSVLRFIGYRYAQRMARPRPAAGNCT